MSLCLTVQFTLPTFYDWRAFAYLTSELRTRSLFAFATKNLVVVAMIDRYRRTVGNCWLKIFPHRSLSMHSIKVNRRARGRWHRIMKYGWKNSTYLFYRWAKKSITFYLLSRDMCEYIRARLMCWNGERWTRTSRWANTGSCVSCGEHRLVCLPTTRAAAAAADIWTLLRKHVEHIVHKHRLHWSLKIIFIQLLLATSPPRHHTPR